MNVTIELNPKQLQECHSIMQDLIKKAIDKGWGRYRDKGILGLENDNGNITIIITEEGYDCYQRFLPLDVKNKCNTALGRGPELEEAFFDEEAMEPQRPRPS